jgi:hypothetical protein
MSDKLPTDEPGWHRWFAAGFFNQAWAHLDAKHALTQDEKDEMLAAALASRLHWSGIGTPMNFAIGDWQVSRVYAVLGDTDQAIRYGTKSLALSEENDLGPFCVGYAHEAIARGKKLSGDPAACADHIKLARAVLPSIHDEHDRKLLANDLNDLEA